MAKDPAMLWYWNDWHSSTVLLSRFLKGCYMDVLHAQFNNGRLSLEEIKICLGSDFGSSWPSIQKKFKQDENDLFFNERLEREKEKRKVFTDSRRQNLTKKPHMETHMANHMDVHMDDHMENENENINEVRKEERTEVFKKLSDRQDFLENAIWKEQFCMAKNISMTELDELQKEFLQDVDLKGEFVDNYKRYFTNHYNKYQPKTPVKNPKKDNNSFV